jgi:hypothetical protein
MRIEWDVVAESVLAQLTSDDKALVRKAVDLAATDWERADAHLLAGAGIDKNVFVLRAGTRFRIVLSRLAKKLVVLDIVPAGQLEGLRGAQRGSAG